MWQNGNNSAYLKPARPRQHHAAIVAETEAEQAPIPDHASAGSLGSTGVKR
jgi:hypothetical protein